MKDVVVILVVVVAAEVPCDNTTNQKASHHHSRPVPGSCHYIGQKRDWISHLFTFINDESGQMKVDNMHAECRVQILRLERVQQNSKSAL